MHIDNTSTMYRRLHVHVREQQTLMFKTQFSALLTRVFDCLSDFASGLARLPRLAAAETLKRDGGPHAETGASNFRGSC